ncbi:MAG: signal recognition particle receptor subunit alpha, partial [Bacteroidota bacterium]
MGFFKKLFGIKNEEVLSEGLEKTKEGFFGKIARAIAGKSTIDADVLDQLEEALVSADVGIDTTIEIIRRVEEKVNKEKYVNTAELNNLLQASIQEMLIKPDHTVSEAKEESGSVKKPYVILIVGVNGVGKTTSIGKLAYQFRQAGKSVMLGAADTFRAAAVDQLTIWSER